VLRNSVGEKIGAGFAARHLWYMDISGNAR
jgi:hypothetical protein